jgi:hypothetical protein
MLKNLIIAIVIIGAGGLIWFSFNNLVEAHTWVSIDPVQCQGNPWAKEVAPEGKEGDEEAEITQFYWRQGIEIFSIESTQVHEIVCQACSCPRGDRLYLEVSADDAQKLTTQGFVEVPSPR